MLGFAVIGAQPGSNEVAVWLTSLVDAQRANHTNAVVTRRDDPRLLDKVRAVTGDRAVLVTAGTVLEGLGLDVVPLDTGCLAGLVEETVEQRDRIIEAVAAYGRKQRTKPVPPEFYGDVDLVEVPLTEDSPPGRALRTATMLARAWTNWLQTEEQRRRRTARPQDGATPWMMPDDLNSPTIAMLPDRFAELTRHAVSGVATHA